MAQQSQTFVASRGDAAQFQGMARQVETDFKRDTLAQQYQEGQLDDNQYLQKLENMVKDYGAGSPIEREMQSAITGQRQTIAEKRYSEYAEGEQKKIQKMISEVELDWKNIQREYVEGKMTTPEFEERQKRYEEFFKGLPDIEIEEYEYKKWAPGTEYSEDHSARFNSVNEMFQRYMRRGMAKGESDYVSGTYEYAPLPWVESTLKLSPEHRDKTGAFYAYGRTRNLGLEQQKIGEIIKGLGRIPDGDEIKAIVYGAYPIEFIKDGNFDRKIGFYE